MPMTITELQSYFNDYHKDFFGFRPCYGTPAQWQDREWLTAQCDIIDSRIENLKKTFKGREELRECGWIIEELDPELAQQAQYLEQERKRFLDEEYERIHSDDASFPEPDWDEIAYAMEVYEDKIVEKMA
jgi:hypothetical protein